MMQIFQELPPAPQRAIAHYFVDTPPETTPRTRTKRGQPALANTGSARDANADGEAYLRRLLAEQLRADLEEDIPSSDVEDDFVDDADSVSISTVHSSYRGDVSDRSSVGPARCVVDFAANDHSENRSPEKNLLTKLSFQ